MIVNDIMTQQYRKSKEGAKREKRCITMVIKKVKGREGRLNEKKCIEGRKGGDYSEED